MQRAARQGAGADGSGPSGADDIRRLDGDSIYLDGVVASVEAHGVAAVTAAIEALLASVVDILGRLIGEDMAIRLIDQDGPRSRTGGRAEAP